MRKFSRIHIRRKLALGNEWRALQTELIELELCSASTTWTAWARAGMRSWSSRNTLSRERMSWLCRVELAAHLKWIWKVSIKLHELVFFNLPATSLTSRHESEIEIYTVSHRCVMINVQERDLIIFLPQHEEYLAEKCVLHWLYSHKLEN